MMEELIRNKCLVYNNDLLQKKNRSRKCNEKGVLWFLGCLFAQSFETNKSTTKRKIQGGYTSSYTMYEILSKADLWLPKFWEQSALYFTEQRIFDAPYKISLGFIAKGIYTIVVHIAEGNYTKQFVVNR